jgi:hypothetical protein
VRFRFRIVAAGKFRLLLVVTKTPRPLELIAAAKEIAGSVTLVADGNNILHLSADGLADIKKTDSDGSVIRREFQNADQP